MGDVDVLEMLFDGDNGILGFDCGKTPDLVGNQKVSAGVSSGSAGSLTSHDDLSGVKSRNTDPNSALAEQLFDSKMMMDTSLGGIDSSEWNSELFTSSLGTADQDDFFSALLETNLPDDVKQQQQFQQPPAQQRVSDHAYSISPVSPNSDSGVSSASPYSPSSSGNEIEDLNFDMDDGLFSSLGLKGYDDADDDMVTSVDPMLLDSLSDCSSTSPALQGNESPVTFDFEHLDQQSSQPVQGLTISTDETTKVIKVLSVNGSTRNQVVHQFPSKQKPATSDSPYPQLMLSDEEKDLLRKEGISLPSHLPLTREEEKTLRSVRRRIRNKASARNSRRKKQDYMEALEKRVKICTDEKRQLEKKVVDLEKRNSSLIGQLKKLQRLVTDSTRQTAKTGTCAMILALSFALVLLPNYRSLIGSNDSRNQDSVVSVTSNMAGRPARSLLMTTDKPATTSNYLPFLNFINEPRSLKEPVDEPIDGLDPYSHDQAAPMDSFKQGVVSSPRGVEENTIHLEITKAPEVVNLTEHESSPPDNGFKHRHIRMDMEDEL